ncbi:MAG: SpoIID/LytB domain-containing protein, partial [Clostridiales bacterium]|nr:SpoIID/LytB domain-containing protein [Clostridiales bacterium]
MMNDRNKSVKMRSKWTISVLLSILTVFYTVSFSSAQYSVPEYIRVGLYFTDSSVHVSTAVSSVSVSAKSGISAGYYQNGTYTEMYNQTTPGALTVRKDSYYYNTGSGYKEYSATDASISSNDKTGPYHIKIGSDYADYASALAGVQTAYAAGIKAYIVYNDTWQVWTGQYTTAASAQSCIAAQLAGKLGTVAFSLIEPASNRIMLLNSSNEPLCLFGSSKAFFQTRPKAENNPLIQTLNTKTYRGAIEYRRITGSDMTVINMVSLKEYLYGNVPAEIGGKSPAEAIKAQAVAASMYAINNEGKHGKTGFDVCATTNCQVYKGYSAEVAGCNAAIDEVAGKVITYNGQLASQIYYFASSAGRTEDPINVWGYSYDYLKSVEDKYEPIYTWTKTLRASDIKAKIPSLGNILGMCITKTSETGRVTELTVRGDKTSVPARYSRERSRTIFSLNSQLYTIKTDADVYVAAQAGSSSAKTQLGGLTVQGAGTAKTVASSSNKITIL